MRGEGSDAGPIYHRQMCEGSGLERRPGCGTPGAARRSPSGRRGTAEGLPDPLLNETTLCSPFCPGQKGLGARAQAATA